MIAMALSQEESKNNQTFIYRKSSTNAENFVKIGPVDIEIISLTETTKCF